MKSFSTFLFLILSVPLVSQAELSSHLGFSSGSMQRSRAGAPSNSFSELDLGLRYRFDETFSLKASFISRFVENDEKYYGGQLTAPVDLSLGGRAVSLHSYLAPGYRFISGYHAPLIEGGLGIKLEALNLGVGYRLIFNDLVGNGLEDESVLFIYTTLGVF